MTAAAPPLAVDLDRTLARTDTFQELLAVAALRRPLRALAVLPALIGGLPRFKAAAARRLGDLAPPLAVNEPLLVWLRGERARGRKLVLVSASHERTVARIAKALGVFDEAFGTDKGNLKGRRKAAFLQDLFPDGFVYAGDSRADEAVWRASRAAVLCGPASRRESALTRRGVAIERVFAELIADPSAWLRAMFDMRMAAAPLALVAPLLAPGATLWAGVSAAAGFALIAAAGALTGGVADLAQDRANPDRAERPFAAGAIQARTGLGAAAALSAGGLAAAAWAGAGWFAAAYAAGLALRVRFPRGPAPVRFAAEAALAALPFAAGVAVAAGG